MVGADGSLNGFGVTVNFTDGKVVLGVRGEVDMVTAPELGAVLDAVIDRGHTSLVLNLDELAFMDAQGLRVVSLGAARLDPLGGELTIRSASVMVRRMLDVADLAERVRVEGPRSAPNQLEPEQSTNFPDVPVKLDVAGLAQHLRRVTSISADDDVVDGALRLVVTLAQATVKGADGVSVSLRRQGRLTTVAASDKTISEMDADQYATGEGPCVDASIEGRRFHAESLDHEVRWPAFVPRAQRLGINAILSHPLMAEDRPLGALNVYSRSAGAFSKKDQELASVFATEASTILRGTGVDASDHQLSARIEEALQTRQIIALAQGVLMERVGIPEEEAYSVLRISSQHTGRPLRDEAIGIVGSTQQSTPAGSTEPGTDDG